MNERPVIYLNEEAMERAKSKGERLVEKWFWRFAAFLIGVACGYAWIFVQGE